VAAARLLSSDYLAIERRLRLIRSAVEIALWSSSAHPESGAEPL
jgi:hypothetical protein